MEDTVYGEDYVLSCDEVRDKIRFVTIGYIENRKGQDILIQAVRLLPEELRQKAEFYLVGAEIFYVCRKTVRADTINARDFFYWNGGQAAYQSTVKEGECDDLSVERRSNAYGLRRSHDAFCTLYFI